jgi:hypothetical protein
VEIGGRMATEFNIVDTVTHLGGTGGILAVGLYFIKKWMNARENAEVDIRKDIAEKTTTVATDLASRHDRSVSDIKDKIQSNRDFYTQTYGDIKCSIDKLAEHVATTNGRTSKLEGAIETVVARCEERSKAFYREVGEERRKQ